jgi:PAS domain S-box-containing protein
MSLFPLRTATNPVAGPAQMWARAFVYFLAVLVTAGALGARLVLGYQAGDPLMLIVFLLPVLLSAYVGGLGPGLVATAMAAAETLYFLIPPLHSFGISSKANLLQWMMFIVLGAMMSVLMDSLRGRQPREETWAGKVRFSIERKVQAGFAFALVCLGGIGVISFLSVTQLDEDTKIEQHTREVISALRRVLATITQAVTGQRGYLITGDETFLQPYTRAVETIDTELQELRRLTADNPKQQTAMKSLAPNVDRRMNILGENIERRRQNGFDAAQEAVRNGQGTRLDEEIQQEITRMENVEQGLLLSREARTQRSSMVTKTVIIGGSLLAFAFVAVALFVIGQDFAGSRRTEAALLEAHDQLERRVAERTSELEQQRAELQLILDTVPALIFFKDLKRRLVRVNLEYARVSGLTREEIIGRTDFDLGLPDAERYSRDDDEVIATGQPKRQLIEPMVTRNGVHWMQADKIPHRDADGRIIGVIGFAMDITERQRVGEMQARLAAIVESSEDAIIGHALDGTITTWNRGAEKVFGYSAQEVAGKSLSMLIPPERADEEPKLQAWIASGKSMDHFETVRVRKGGKRIDIAASVSPLKDDRGKIVGSSTIARDITDRKAAERRALWLASFPERNPNPIVELDLARDVVHYLNPCAELRFPDLRSKRLSHALLAGLAEVEKTLSEGRKAAIQREVAVGESFYSQNITYIREAQRLRVYSTDITDLRKVEMALHAADHRLAEIIHGMTEACFALDADWRFTFVNNRCEVLLRRSREAMMGHSIWEIFPQLHGTVNERYYRQVMKERIPVVFESFSTVAECWVDIRVFPSGDGLAAFFLDITDRKALEAERQKFVSLAENSVEFIGMCDLRGVPLFVNEAGRRLVGLESVEQAMQTPVAEFFYPKDQAFITGTFLPNVQRDGHGEVEIRFRHFKTGEPIWMLYNVFVIHDAQDQPVGFATVSRNITERRLAEEEVRRLNSELEERVVERTAQLESANKELEAFSYSVSHDLRAPLRSVDGFSQAVLEDYGSQLPEDGVRYLQKIRNGAQRMGNLIDDLLTFSRLSRAPIESQTIDSVKLVRTVLEDLQAGQARRAIDLRVGDLPPSEGDPALLKQVWVNLLSNALKYTRKREKAVVEIGCNREQSGNVFFVRDNGTGFDMRYVGKLFGVFQRLHRAEDYEGTGVGLAIVQRVINRHGGRIWAEAAVDCGATFYFTLPDKKPV